MILCRHLVLALSSLFLIANSTPGTFHRESYTILPNLHLDLDRMVVHQFASGRIQTHRIEDCSTDEAFCIQSTCGSYGYPRITPPDCKVGDEFAMIWPRACAHHFEIGDTIEANGITGRVIGYFQRVIHHTGMRNRELVFAIDGKPNMALLVSRHRLRGIILDESGEGQIARRFADKPVLDASEADDPNFPGLVATVPSPSSIAGKCTS